MHQTQSAIVQAATELVRARRTGRRLEALPCDEVLLGLEQGFEIQQQVGVLAGKTVGGWKCAMPKPGKWIVAPIYTDSIVRTPRYPLDFATSTVRIEPELACVLGADLPARSTPYTADDILRSISQVHLSLEVIDCRYADPHKVNFEQLLADGLFNHGLVLGPQAISLDARNLPLHLDVTLSYPGVEPVSICGAHPDHDPVSPIVWLANFLSARGIDLRTGQVVITGSYAGVLEVPIHQPLNIQFGEAGSLPVFFSTLEE
ncbi:fumarylacetoacetate hydrolase family protein [Pseudomonas sp. LJDD11]|uniref:2-keto-4-pentenoate hydratase n=1 Tax=Pseudomonas sp. LJDD11 TaxID=2931984 RepID=UPI00211CB096|nr:fumarylacetoacetate hydrolase family protein [Pseudomonas sp. LJDD11]MCQ9426794.1 fumarylacetoacetate hydrolase family protein [Pseudomonas sp. LJDD11]